LEIVETGAARAVTVSAPLFPSAGTRDVVLVGGGHTHALVLAEFARRPLSGATLTLISDVEHAAYSGMLPGHVAGFYTHDEMHIDLRALCARAGARFVSAAINGIDLEKRQVQRDGVAVGRGRTCCRSTSVARRILGRWRAAPTG
jgi:selenide,water dikinase